MNADQVENMLLRTQPRRLSEGFAREAAVLMLIFECAAEPHFLLTLRTEEVSTHKGQISFPGGMHQAGESLEQTALRETYEEVGITSDRIRILGRFHDYLSITGDRVATFPAFIQGTFATAPQQGEVAEVLQVPWSVFADPTRLRTERMLRLGRLIDVYYYRYQPCDIWGLTAHIIKDFFDELSR
jgi:8-oxo-dGTP pyrophosphatase MutT (NUDIX family)